MKKVGKDGRYGWLVVCATFVVTFMVDGIHLSFGVLLIELLQTFNQGRASTSIIGALVLGVTYLIGPIAGVLSEKFGCRIIVITGSLISASGFFASVFVDKLVYLYVTYGLFGGLGFGLMYLPATVCLMQHFDKHRGIANGIAMSGSGAGTFAFNHFTAFLLREYGWRGTILIQAGIVLNGIVCGLIFVSPDGQKEQPPLDRTVEFSTNEIENGAIICTYNNSAESCTFENIAIDVTEDGTCCTDNSTQECIDKGGNVVKDTEENNKDMVNGVPEMLKTKQDAAKFGISNDCNDDTDSSSRSSAMRNESLDKPMTMCRKLCDWSLLKNRKLLALLSSVLFAALAYAVPFNYIPDQAVVNGMNKQQASWLAASMGIANIISRITIGLVADRKFVNRLVLLECLLFSLGTATILSVFMVSFPAKMIYTCVYGFLIGNQKMDHIFRICGLYEGCYVVLNYVVMADLFGVDVVARSLGLMMFMIGVGALLSSPSAGWLYDQTGSYEIPFIVAGSEFILGACIPSILFLIERFNNKASYHLHPPPAES